MYKSEKSYHKPELLQILSLVNQPFLPKTQEERGYLGELMENN